MPAPQDLEVTIASLHERVQKGKPDSMGLLAFALTSRVNAFLKKEIIRMPSPLAPILDVGRELGEHMGLVHTEASALSVGFFLRAVQPNFNVEPSPRRVLQTVRSTVNHLLRIDPSRKDEVDAWVGTAALAGFSLGSLLSCTVIKPQFVQERMGKLSLEVTRLRPEIYEKVRTEFRKG